MFDINKDSENKILSDKQIKEFYLISKNNQRGPHKNWCTFTDKEMYLAILTIIELKKEIEDLKRLNKMYLMNIKG